MPLPHAYLTRHAPPPENSPVRRPRREPPPPVPSARRPPKLPHGGARASCSGALRAAHTPSALKTSTHGHRDATHRRPRHRTPPPSPPHLHATRAFLIQHWFRESYLNFLSFFLKYQSASLDPSHPHPRAALRMGGGSCSVLLQWSACWSPLPPPRGSGRLVSSEALFGEREI